MLCTKNILIACISQGSHLRSEPEAWLLKWHWLDILACQTTVRDLHSLSPKSFRLTAPQLAISVKVTPWSQTLSYSFLQPSLAWSFTLQSRQTEGKVWGLRGSLVLAALQKLRGNGDLSAELEEMLAEQAAVKGQRAKNPRELFQNPAVRWQLLSIVVLSSAMQLCGNDSVSSLAAMAIGSGAVLQDTASSSWV